MAPDLDWHGEFTIRVDLNNTADTQLARMEQKLLRALAELRSTMVALSAAERDSIQAITTQLDEIDTHVQDALGKAQQTAADAVELARLAQSNDEADQAKIAELAAEIEGHASEVVAALQGVAEHASAVDDKIGGLVTPVPPADPPVEPTP